MSSITKEFIFRNHNKPFQCHASTLLHPSENTFLAAWFAGSKEGENDVAIWGSRFENGVWEEPRMLSSESGIPHWNPVLFQLDDGTVQLYYKVGYTIPDWKTYRMTSSDEGKTWTKAEELVPNDCSGGRGPVKNKAIHLSNGRILAPCSTEQGRWLCFADLSDDQTKTFSKHPIPASDDADMIQPSFWEQPNGEVHAFMRSNKGRIYRSDSTDFGENWCPAYPIELPNNNSGLDCVKADNGNIYVLCNPVEKNWGARSPLTIFVSADNGLHFKKLLDLETEEGEYSYPAMIAHKNHLYGTYTYNREGIVFWSLDL